MIKQVSGKNDEPKYIYESPSNEKKQDFFKNLVISFENYADSNNINTSKVEFDFKLINEISVRVDKREDYYLIFHDGTQLNEVRESALVSFWILKFKPFLITSDDGKDYNLNINCGFALYMMLGAVSEYIEREYNGNKKLSINEDYLNKLKYAFKYWDLSKEAMMLVAETLCMCVKDKE